MLRQDIQQKNIPDTPGVYHFRDADNVILYIGRATSLKSRIGSYFAKDLIATRGPRIVSMVEEAHDVTWEETDSVLEAIILEANEIRNNKPPYNIKEKDDKSFYWLVITDENFPRIFPVRERELQVKGLRERIKYSFGPFPSGTLLRDALKIIRKIFPFRDKKSTQAHTERFYQQIGLAPDTGDTQAKKEYRKTIQHVRMFFEGKKKKLLKDLEKEMNVYAKKQAFEKAQKIRDQIYALEHLREVTLLGRELEEKPTRRIRIEAYDIAHTQGKGNVGVMTVVSGGETEKSQYRKFSIEEEGNNDTKQLAEILKRRLAHPEWDMPDLVVVDGGKAQRNKAEKVFDEYGIAIPVVSVVKDERHQPKRIEGESTYVHSFERDILLANSEAHRFAISFHRKKMRKRG